jgi:hypothetical protein
VDRGVVVAKASGGLSLSEPGLALRIVRATNAAIASRVTPAVGA